MIFHLLDQTWTSRDKNAGNLISDLAAGAFTDIVKKREQFLARMENDAGVIVTLGANIFRIQKIDLDESVCMARNDQE